jgi:predicted porin
LFNLGEIHMKKSLVALAALAASAAFAQSSVTLYGIIDMGFGTINHAPNNDPYNSAAGPVQPTSAANTLANQFVGSAANTQGVAVGRLTSMLHNNTATSRWGIKGVEDIGGGTKANFTLESFLNPATGSNPNGKINDSQPGSNTGSLLGAEGSATGAMFAREATVGLEGSMGSLKLGRQLNPMADAVGAYDPMKAGFAVSPLGFNGGYSGGGYTTEARWDNSLKYAFNINNELTARFGYRTGNMSGIGAAANAMAANLEYNTPQWGAILSAVSVHDAVNDGNINTISGAPNGVTALTGAGTAGVSASGNVSSSATTQPSITAYYADTSATLLAFRVSQGPVTYKFGWEHIQIKNPSNTAGLSTANIPSLYGIPVSSVNFTSYDTPQVQNMYFVGANWQVSAPLELSAAYYRRTDSAYGSMTSAAANAAYVITGGKPYSLTGSSKAEYFSLMANYSLSKRTRLYATANFTKVEGPAWTTTQYTQVASGGGTAPGTTGNTGVAKFSTSGYGNTFTVPNIQAFTVGMVHNF